MFLIDTKDKAAGVAYFFVKEWLRHQADMNQIEQDLKDLAEKWGIDLPDPKGIDPKEWIKI
jgi:hypothetical protein